MFKLYTENSEKGEGGKKKKQLQYLKCKILSKAFMLTISFLHFPLSVKNFCKKSPIWQCKKNANDYPFFRGKEVSWNRWENEVVAKDLKGREKNSNTRQWFCLWCQLLLTALLPKKNRFLSHCGICPTCTQTAAFSSLPRLLAKEAAFKRWAVYQTEVKGWEMGTGRKEIGRKETIKQCLGGV